MLKLTKELDETLAILVKNGLLVEIGSRIKPSSRFAITMTVMLMYFRKNLDGHKESEGIFRIVDDEDGILDGLLATTIVHYHKHHLSINKLDFKESEGFVNAMKLFYSGQSYIKYINNVVYDNEDLTHVRLYGEEIKFNRSNIGVI